MITPKISLTISQVFNVAFSVGMCFFTDQMMSVYKAGTFTGTSKVAFFNAMNLFGLQQVQSSIFCATMKRSDNKRAVSVACFMIGFAWIFFAFSDGLNLALGNIPDIFPAESMYANLVLFTFIGGCNFYAWKESGSHLPDFSKLVVTGDLALPLNLGSLNLSFFGLWLAISPDTFFEQFAPGVMDSLPNNAVIKPVLMLILGNSGKAMICNILACHATISADASDNDTKYRLLRTNIYTGMCWLGTFSKDSTVNLMTGWPEPMKIMTFASCFPVIFFQAWSLGQVKVKVPKSIKSA